MLIGNDMRFAFPSSPARAAAYSLSPLGLRKPAGPASADSAQPSAATEDQPTNARNAADQPVDPRQQQQIEQQVAELASRDREVRAHEQAHAAVGGSYAGAATYSFTRGPDGKRYATSGEVSIDVSPIPNDPQATLSKMDLVRRAALAPAEPSGQDLRVAAQAQALAAQARTELAVQRAEEFAGGGEQASSAQPQEDKSPQGADAAAQQAASATPNLELYLQLSQVAAAPARVDVRA